MNLNNYSVAEIVNHLSKRGWSAEKPIYFGNIQARFWHKGQWFWAIYLYPDLSHSVEFFREKE